MLYIQSCTAVVEHVAIWKADVSSVAIGVQV